MHLLQSSMSNGKNDAELQQKTVHLVDDSRAINSRV